MPKISVSDQKANTRATVACAVTPATSGNRRRIATVTANTGAATAATVAVRSSAVPEPDLELGGDEQDSRQADVGADRVAQQSANASDERHLVTVNPTTASVIGRSTDPGEHKDQPTG